VRKTFQNSLKSAKVGNSEEIWRLVGRDKKGISTLKKKSKVYTLEELFEQIMASTVRPRIKLRVPVEIVAFIRGCHPQLIRKIRAGLQHIVPEPESGKSLKDELEGLNSYQISRFRIIYRISSKQTIDIIAVGPRKTIYEKTYRIIRKEAKQ
jgi:mRNA-degrading endonuclease RelE of RelBE toxin-antitoxin system